MPFTTLYYSYFSACSDPFLLFQFPVIDTVAKGLYFAWDFLSLLMFSYQQFICVYSMKGCLFYFMYLFIFSVNCFTVPFINYIVSHKWVSCFGLSKSSVRWSHLNFLWETYSCPKESCWGEWWNSKKEHRMRRETIPIVSCLGLDKKS